MAVQDIDSYLYDYHRLHLSMDHWLVVSVPDLEVVYNWRLEAEREMRAAGRSSMTDMQVCASLCVATGGVTPTLHPSIYTGTRIYFLSARRIIGHRYVGRHNSDISTHRLYEPYRFALTRSLVHTMRREFAKLYRVLYMLPPLFHNVAPLCVMVIRSKSLCHGSCPLTTFTRHSFGPRTAMEVHNGSGKPLFSM